MEKIEVTYSLVVEEHEGGYLAYFPALPGCHTWGKTYKDAVEYAEEALAAYLDALMAHGDENSERDRCQEAGVAWHNREDACHRVSMLARLLGQRTL